MYKTVDGQTVYERNDKIKGLQDIQEILDEDISNEKNHEDAYTKYVLERLCRAKEVLSQVIKDEVELANAEEVKRNGATHK